VPPTPGPALTEMLEGTAGWSSPAAGPWESSPSTHRKGEASCPGPGLCLTADWTVDDQN